MVEKKLNKGKKETLYFFMLNLSSKALTYFLLLIFANLFTVIDYGEAAFVLSAFTFITVLSQLGVPYVLIPYLVKNDGREKSIFWFLVLFTSLFTIAGFLFCLNFMWIMPLIISFPFLLFYGVGRSILRARHEYHLVQITDLILTILIFAFVVLFSTYGKTGIIIAYAVSNVLISLLTLFWTAKQIRKLAFPFQLDWKITKGYLSKAAIAFVLFVSIDVLNKMDSLLLGVLSTYQNVAIYNISSSIATLIWAVPVSISMFLLTRSAEIQDEQVSKNVFSRCTRISFSISLLAAVALNALIFLIIEIFFKKYQGTEIFVAIISCAALFFSVFFLFFNYLTGKLSPEKAFKPMLIATAVNLLLDIVLIGPFGVLGICVATVIAQGTALALFGFRVMGWKRLLVFYASTVFVFAAFLLREWGLLVLIPAAAYLLFTRSITKEDITVVKETFGKSWPGRAGKSV